MYINAVFKTPNYLLFHLKGLIVLNRLLENGSVDLQPLEIHCSL